MYCLNISSNKKAKKITTLFCKLYCNKSILPHRKIYSEIINKTIVCEKKI